MGMRANNPRRLKAINTGGDAISPKELMDPSCLPANANTKLPGIMPMEVAII
jgi:hypothetical protein